MCGEAKTRSLFSFSFFKIEKWRFSARVEVVWDRHPPTKTRWCFEIGAESKVAVGCRNTATGPRFKAACACKIRDYCCTAEAKGAIIHLLLDAFGRRVHTIEMAAMRDEFVSNGDERENFFGMIEVTRDDWS